MNQFFNLHVITLGQIKRVVVTNIENKLEMDGMALNEFEYEDEYDNEYDLNDALVTYVDFSFDHCADTTENRFE